MHFGRTKVTNVGTSHVSKHEDLSLSITYLDHSATTPVDQYVLEQMLPFFTNTFGNPSSLHQQGYISKQAVDRARQQAATFMGCTPKELLFTGSGSESDNLAIKGLVAGYTPTSVPAHIITSAVEHHAVERTVAQLEKQFHCMVTRLPVDQFGMVDPDAVRKAIRHETILISIMQANNEVGSVQPVQEIAAIAHDFGIPFHTDAVQAAPWLDVSVLATHADLISISGHKMYGPKGIGALYVRQHMQLAPVISGGGQEFGLRSGTENVPLIVGLGEAMQLVAQRRMKAGERIRKLRDQLIEGVLAQVEDAYLTGHAVMRLPHHASFVFKDVDARVLLEQLNAQGIMASSGAACSSHSATPSHVLLAMGIPVPLIDGSLRLTLGYETSQEDIDKTLGVLPRLISRIRHYRPTF